jgi:hypothetical protein
MRPSPEVYSDSSLSTLVRGSGLVEALMVMDCGSVNAIGITPRAPFWNPDGGLARYDIPSLPSGRPDGSNDGFLTVCQFRQKCTEPKGVSLSPLLGLNDHAKGSGCSLTSVKARRRELVIGVRSNYMLHDIPIPNYQAIC